MHNVNTYKGGCLCPSVHPHVLSWKLLNRFKWNFTVKLHNQQNLEAVSPGLKRSGHDDHLFPSSATYLHGVMCLIKQRRTLPLPYQN
jgi:hypothetical protein